jgi:hypothetical protein
MDIFFQEPSEIPLPPAEVRLRSLKAEPYPDSRRVRVKIEIAPFQKRPSLELLLRDENENPAGQTHIIETMINSLELTLHIRQAEPRGTYTLTALLFYTNAPAPEETQLPERMVVDESSIQFAVAS